MIFTAFEVYIRLVERIQHNFQVHQFAYLLSKLALQINLLAKIRQLENNAKMPQYFDFIIPRIFLVVNSTIDMVDSCNTEFAIWCAKRASSKLG